MKIDRFIGIVVSFFTAILTAFTPAVTFSQDFGGCATKTFEEAHNSKYVGCGFSSDTWINQYRTPGYWIPNANTPLKTIRVNWIVCRDNNGQNGWQDTPEFRAQVDLMFSNINLWYSNSQPKGYTLTCEPTYSHISDTRIRFELNQIIFIDSTIFNTGCFIGTQVLNYIHSKYPDSKYALNHIFSQPSSPCYGRAWGYYSANGPNNSAFVETWGSMFSTWWVVWEDHINHITHEYGHAVGLHHTYDGEIRCTNHFDFLDDVFGMCAEPTCAPSCLPPSGCSNYICYLTNICFWDIQNPPHALMSPKNNSRYISPKAAGRMHRSLSLYENVFVVDNKPMHKYVKEKYSSQPTKEITSNEVWDFPIKLYQDIVVCTGAILEIKCEVLMPIQGKIIVKPGAKLIIDGGKINSAHDAQWQGIEVWGTTTQHQSTINGVCYQGSVELKNGAVIENAYNGITNWKPDDWNSIGGIIIANNATFRNNRRSVEFMKYRNFNPANGHETDNLSNFTNCTFDVTDAYPSGASPFVYHVSLWSVKGVQFNGCDVLNSRINNYTGTGILSLDAGYKVLPISGTTTDKSYFQNFASGISASNSETVNSVYVNNAKFTNNGYGISLQSINGATVLNSLFEIGTSPNCPNQGYGISMNACSGYTIQENTFTGGTATGTTFKGISVTSSGTAYNEIYKNNFQNLNTGNVANLQNGAKYPPNGLTWLCNTNTGNKYDFSVTSNSASCISPFQRSGTSFAAGNSFSSNATLNFGNGAVTM